MSYTGNYTYADEQNIDVAHPDYVPVRERRAPRRAPRRDDLITWAKLGDGSWGIKGIGLISGATATVTKANGETSEVVVGEVKNNGRYDFATVVRAPRTNTTVTVTAEVTVAAASPQIPDGRYAVYNNDQSVNDIAFYKVENVTEGKWAGWTFVRQIVGGGEQNLGKAQRQAVLAKIAAFGPCQASELYGKTTQRCGVCHTNLTNKESRARGIGPVCAENMGW